MPHRDSNHAAWAKTMAVFMTRVALGGILVALGVDFATNMHDLMAAVPGQGFALGAFLLAHYIIVAHIGGGVMIGLGLLTRWSAIGQLPILAGALLLVDFGQGFFDGMSLSFTILVTAMVILTTILGGGRLSVDRHLRRLVAPETGHLPA